MKDCCYRVVEIKIYKTEKSSWMEEEEEEEEEEKSVSRYQATFALL